MPTTDWKSRKKLLHSRDGPFGITYAYALVKVMAFHFLFYFFYYQKNTFIDKESITGERR